MERTLIIISVMVSALSCTKPEIVVDKQKFEPVYRAGMAVDAATNVGVTYVRFMELVQNYATEVNLAKTKISNDRERFMLDKYEGALVEYTRSVAQWKAALNSDDKTPMQQTWQSAAELLHDGDLIYENKPKPMPH